MDRTGEKDFDSTSFKSLSGNGQRDPTGFNFPRHHYDVNDSFRFNVPDPSGERATTSIHAQWRGDAINDRAYLVFASAGTNDFLAATQVQVTIKVFQRYHRCEPARSR
jgi:hypothetical protein